MMLSPLYRCGMNWTRSEMRWSCRKKRISSSRSLNYLHEWNNPRTRTPGFNWMRKGMNWAYHGLILIGSYRILIRGASANFTKSLERKLDGQNSGGLD